MAGKEDNRIFVGGLSSDVTERQLERTFSRFGDILDCQMDCLIMRERDTGRPRGFGFITFAERRAMEEAIREMHGRELGDRVISVNRAEPKAGGGDDGDTYGGFRNGGTKGNYGRGAGGGGGRTGEDECFKCGRVGHWARDCPSAATGGRGGPMDALSSRPRFGGSSGRMDRYDVRDRFMERDQYVDNRYDGVRFGDRDRLDRFDDRYSYPGRDRYVADRYPPPADRFGSDRYGGGNSYGKGRVHDRDIGGPQRGNDRFGGPGPVRDDGRSYRNRPGPYDRPARGGGSYQSFDRY